MTAALIIFKQEERLLIFTYIMEPLLNFNNVVLTQHIVNRLFSIKMAIIVNNINL